jgi:hypothetical protein
MSTLVEERWTLGGQQYCTKICNSVWVNVWMFNLYGKLRTLFEIVAKIQLKQVAISWNNALE